MTLRDADSFLAGSSGTVYLALGDWNPPLPEGRPRGTSEPVHPPLPEERPRGTSGRVTKGSR
jgi:hypothetical protein